MLRAGSCFFTTTRDKINLKWNSILEEHMIETCTVVVHAMAQKYIKPDQWTWLIVGDLSKIEESVRNLNLGTVTILEK